MIGSTISHYRILEKIGAGGMGVVYKAEDCKLGRSVALKFLSDDLRAKDHRALERFQREARTASALNHPNICTIYEIDEADGQTFIAMELLDGETLKHRIGASRVRPDGGAPGRPCAPFQNRVLLNVAVQVVDALDAAHSRGIIHRDLKPGNIFISPRGQVKVLDFGMAKLARESVRAPNLTDASFPTVTIEESLSIPGVPMGTLLYMSPEQARGEELDARSDLFSFGAVFYEMATGNRAFAGSTPAIIFDAILNRAPTPASRLNPDLLLCIEAIIDKALKKDREQRYQAAADVRHDLAEALDSLARPAQDLSSSRATERVVTVCPYRGLRAFREQDAAFFAGREAFSERLFETTLSRNLVAIIGPSGSGKSSVVHAGLIPLLRRQRPPEKTWESISFTPGNRPFHRLAAAIIPLLEAGLSETDRMTEAQKLGDRMSNGELPLDIVVERVLEKSNSAKRLLLVVDQCEELFTLTPENDRRPFMKTLLQAQDLAPACVLLTLRADFYGHAIGLSRELSDRLEGSVVNLGCMTRKELERTLLQPAGQVDLEFERGLADRILDDVVSEPGSLPLLEFALTELWDRRQGALLTHRAYEEMGEVAGAIAKRAEAEFAKLTPEQQAMAPRALTHLVRVARPEEGGEDTRQRADLGTMPPLAQQVVQALANARLLVTGRDEATGRQTADVAHEALIRNWTRFRDWINDDREFLLWRQRLRAGLSEWQRMGRDEGALLPKALLAVAEAWMERRAEDLSAEEHGFIQTSRERQAREDKRWQDLYEEAERQRRISVSRHLSANADRALDEDSADPQLGLLLAVEAMRQFQTEEAEQVLRRGLTLLPRKICAVTHRHAIVRVAFSPDGRYLATASQDHTARVWEPSSGREMARLPHEGGVVSVSFSPDGQYLGTASHDRTARLWEVPSWRQVARITHGDTVCDLAFSAPPFSSSGQLVATASHDGTARVWEVTNRREVASMIHETAVLAVSFFVLDPLLVATVGEDGTARVWHPMSGCEFRRITHDGGVEAIAFTADPSVGRLALADENHTTRVWDLFYYQRGMPVLATAVWDFYHSNLLAEVLQEERVLAIAFSSDLQCFATASSDHIARIYESVGGREVARMTHDGTVRAVAFSPDGRYLATASSDNLARLWDARTGKEVTRMSHAAPVRCIAFSPDGGCLATSHDRSVQIWQTNTPEISRMRHDGSVLDIRFSLDGRYMTTTSSWNWGRMQWSDIPSTRDSTTLKRRLKRGPAEVNGSVSTWDSTTGQLIDCLPLWDSTTAKEINAEINAWPRWRCEFRAALSPNGDHLAIACDGSWVYFATIRPVAGSSPEVARIKHRGAIHDIVFSPDGQYLVIASDDDSAVAWHTTSRAEVLRLSHEGPVLCVAFSSDVRYLATASHESVIVWEVPSGRRIALMPHAGGVRELGFSPDSKYLAAADKDVQVWSAISGQEIAQIAHIAPVRGIAFSHDDRYLAAACQDRTVRIWNTSSGREVCVIGHKNNVYKVVFSPDGQHLASLGAWETHFSLEKPPTRSLGPWETHFSLEKPPTRSLGDPETIILWRWQPSDLIAEACSRLTRNLTEDEWRRYIGDERYRKTCPNLP